MKRKICLLLSFFILLTVLTSCDFLPVESFLSEPPTAQPEVTTPQPEKTTTAPDATTPEPDVTTSAPTSTTPTPEINYGTLNNPVTTTYAYEACANLAEGESSAEPFYVKGTVTSIGETKNYYKNVYFTDGKTEMLIYTINMSNGITGFAVGDTITACGYIKNYMGTIEMATYEGSVYVYVVKVEPASGNQGGTDTSKHTYTAFTSSEKALFNNAVGLVIPFISNDDYYVEEYEYENEVGINFYTFGNTQAEFNAYRELFSSYTYEGSEKDTYGDTWYYYAKGDVYVDMSFYYYENEYVVDIYVYVIAENGGTNPGDTPSGYLYTEFTDAEKALFNSAVGFVIPFVANNEYYVEEYENEDEIGVNFYAFGNTQAEFNAYRALFSSYSYDGSEKDDYGDTWYFYSKGDVYVDMSYYYYENGYVIDVFVYVTNENTGNIGGGDTPSPTDNVLTNAGAGLPSSANGIYDVDFTKGNYVQNVTDQGYYLDGCPTTGSPAVLVIPVEFIDATANSRGYSIENIKQIFSGNNTAYYSVHDYFFISSYQTLDLDITVLDSWFRPKNSSSYYQNATYDYYDEEMEIGDQLILDEALAYLATIMDLSKFDSDNNGTIDAVVMVNTLDIGDDNFHWAYRYWNVYTDDYGYYYEYDGVSANDYIWISYEFVFEGYDENGDVNYDRSNPLNPYTFIHEFSHVLGADDYYDTEYEDHPLGGYDMMDAMPGDHNPYTKFNYGWITTSKLIVTNSSVTVNLEAFAKNGDTILLANNWDATLGAYQEYYVIMYYTQTDLNAGEAGFFARDGILVYHINSSLYAEEYDGETYYDIYNTNTSANSPYGTENNLIEFVLTAEGHYTYVAGDSLPATTDDLGNALAYTFVVDAIDADSATITFTKK